MRLIKLYILADIKSIQWMAQSEAEFNLVCEQYKEHYLQQELSELERKLVTDFITYFLAQWGPGSHAAQWYAGAHPFSLTNNQVINRLSISKRKNACVFYSDVVKNKCNLYREWKAHIKRSRQTTPLAQSFPWASSSRCWSSWLNPSHHMAFLHCVLSNVSSNCLLQKKHINNRSIFGFFHCFQMKFQIGRLNESISSFVALIWLFSTMCYQMLSSVSSNCLPQ